MAISRTCFSGRRGKERSPLTETQATRKRLRCPYQGPKNEANWDRQKPNGNSDEGNEGVHNCSPPSPNTTLSSRRGWGAIGPRKAVVPHRSAAAAGSARTSPRTKPRRPDYRITTPPRPHPGRAMPPSQLTVPHDGRPSAARPGGHPLQPPLPTTPKPWASFLTDNSMSATENQHPVSMRVPNTTLSSRGR